jgi:hypothetical protein
VKAHTRQNRLAMANILSGKVALQLSGRSIYAFSPGNWYNTKNHHITTLLTTGTKFGR